MISSKAYVGAQLNFAVMSEMHALIINVPTRAQELSKSIETRALSTRSQSSSCGSMAKRRLFYRLWRHCETQKLISINAVPPDVCKPLMASSPGQQLAEFPRHSDGNAFRMLVHNGGFGFELSRLSAVHTAS